ncbi:hypothetical protein BGX38DRAFT_679114 [Terfezia claveryi]|nr:hypothetical protein BGX38DRAFT_679114 [Terfezia claveryi]
MLNFMRSSLNSLTASSPPSPTSFPLPPSPPFPTTPAVPPSPEFMSIEVPSRYAEPLVSVYPPTRHRPYQTLELTFPTPRTVIPRAFLESSTGQLTVVFRTPRGPKCKGGPGRYQETSTYQLFLPAEWLGCEQDLDENVDGFGPTREWSTENVWISEGEEEEEEWEEWREWDEEDKEDEEEGCGAKKGFRVLFYGRRLTRDAMEDTLLDEVPVIQLGHSESLSPISRCKSRFRIE